MKKTLLTILLIFSTLIIGFANPWYVSGNGNDTNDGKSLATAFRTLQKAADLVQPGDVVWVGNGTYTTEDKKSGGAVLSINTSGEADAWITWRAINGQYPIIRPYGWAAIQITASYQIIEGLTIIGNNDALALVDAQEDAKKAIPDPTFNTNGIFVNGRPKKPSEKPHHIIIRNCSVSKCPGGGIQAIEADYITIEDCLVFENAWFMRYGGSGISTLNNWAFNDAPGYHMVIQRNYVWNNKTQVAWEKIGRLSDGNGIILDVTDQEEEQGATNPNGDAIIANDYKIANQTPVQAKPKRPEWTGRALVANNVCAFNGGSGIHTFRTRHVDIVNNTTYWNGQNMGYPELFANRSHDVVILNNIMVPRPSGKVTSNTKNTGNRWDFNLYPVSQNILNGPNDIVADPKFVDLERDLQKGNFRLLKGSPALNSGTNEVPQKTDITGKLRPLKGRDRGAFEQ